jgi:transposase
VVKAYNPGNTSIRQLATRFDVNKSFVERLLSATKLQEISNHNLGGGSQESVLNGYSSQLHELVKKYPDSTLSEYCEYWVNIYGQ